MFKITKDMKDKAQEKKQSTIVFKWTKFREAVERKS